LARRKVFEPTGRIPFPAKAQQLSLRGLRQTADLVEEQVRPPQRR